MMPRVSVIIPNYNHSAFLRQRIDSVLNQDLIPLEIIVLDDASTDNSRDIIASYGDKITRVIYNKTNSGSPFRQWERGLEVASGDWIWIAESDDYCKPHFLSTLLKDVPASVGMVYAQTFDVQDGEIIVDRLRTTDQFEPNIWQADFQLDGMAFCKHYLSVKNVVPNASAVVFRKPLAEGIISDEMRQMRMCGDWLFWAKLISKTQIAFKAEHLNYFRNHPGVSRDHNSLGRISSRLFEEAVLREIFATYQVDQEAQLRALRRKWFRIHRITQLFSSEFNRINQGGLFPRLSLKFILFKLIEKLDKWT